MILTFITPSLRGLFTAIRCISCYKEKLKISSFKCSDDIKSGKIGHTAASVSKTSSVTLLTRENYCYLAF